MTITAIHSCSQMNLCRQKNTLSISFYCILKYIEFKNVTFSFSIGPDVIFGKYKDPLSKRFPQAFHMISFIYSLSWNLKCFILWLESSACNFWDGLYSRQYKLTQNDEKTFYRLRSLGLIAILKNIRLLSRRKYL